MVSRTSYAVRKLETSNNAHDHATKGWNGRGNTYSSILFVHVRLLPVIICIYQNLGSVNVEERKQSIHWCKNCKTPVITKEKKVACPLCDEPTKRMCADMRPVFPEERLLIEVLLKKPLAFLENTVWASTAGRYYVDGKSLRVPQELYHYKNAQWVRDGLEKYRGQNNGTVFEKSIERFILANKKHLEEIQSEAIKFIQSSTKKFPEAQSVISFSGGKDSTVVSDLVMQALRQEKVDFVFGDTTLEFPQTYEYVERFKRDNPQIKFVTAKNEKQDFFEICKDIGPPSKHMRWCCTMFKTGPIAKAFSKQYKKKTVLSFIGIRANESNGRKYYPRIDADVSNRKIQQQISIHPILNWMEIDVWLHVLSGKLDFSHAYCLGHKRAGCWVCPNSANKSVFLHHVYMIGKSFAWRNQLLDFAVGIGKTSIENYVDDLKWTFRRGGAGLKASEDVIVKSIGCTVEEDAEIFALNKPISTSFYTLFHPLGIVSKEHGRDLLGEVLVLDRKNKTPILSIQPFSSGEYTHAVKMKVLSEKNKVAVRRKVTYQVRKYNACRNCGQCDSVCVLGAIKIKAETYEIIDGKCTRCKKCIDPKFVRGGCLMTKMLWTEKRTT